MYGERKTKRQGVRRESGRQVARRRSRSGLWACVIGTRLERTTRQNKPESQENEPEKDIK